VGSRKVQMPMRCDYIRDLKCNWYLYPILKNSIIRPVLFQGRRVEVLSGHPTSSMISVESKSFDLSTIKQAARPSLPPPSADIPNNLARQINITACLTDSSCCTTSRRLAYPELQPRYTGPIKRNLDCRLNRSS
jgi:hypothetical protein